MIRFVLGLYTCPGKVSIVKVTANVFNEILVLFSWSAVYINQVRQATKLGGLVICNTETSDCTKTDMSKTCPISSCYCDSQSKHTNPNHNNQEHGWWNKCFCVSFQLFNIDEIVKDKVTQSWGLPHKRSLWESRGKWDGVGGKYLMRAEGILPFLMECDPQSLLASVNPTTLGHSPSSVQR